MGNNIVEHSDIASPVDVSLTTSTFSTYHMASMDWANTLWGLYYRFVGNL